MWHSIESRLSETLAEKVQFIDKQQVSGGDISQCYQVTCAHSSKRFFIKINTKSHYELLACEADNLTHLHKANCIQVPKVILLGQTREFAYLVLEYLPLQPESGNWTLFGQQLARLHQASEQAEFGWHQENYIGFTLQPNQWQKNWQRFFIEQRLAWQLQLLAEKSVSFGKVDYLLEVFSQILAHHKPKPSLLHGDLWYGNVGFVNKSPVLFDPACYYGDRETDIAMTELFSGFPTDFYQGYNAIWPLSKGYEQRKTLYNLYHILNHANLFGGSYINQAKAIINRLISASSH